MYNVSCLSMRSPIFDNVYLKSGKIALQHYDIKVGSGLDKNDEFKGLVGTEMIARIVNSETLIWVCTLLFSKYMVFVISEYFSVLLRWCNMLVLKVF